MKNIDLTLGVVLTGDRVSAFRQCAEWAKQANIAVVDTSIATDEQVVTASQRYRAAGQSLVVIAPSTDSVPAPALVNFQSVLSLLPYATPHPARAPLSD